MINSENHKEKDIEIIEEIPIELLQQGINISQKEVLEHNFLILEELEGNFLNGHKLTINAKGLKDGLRSVEDGISFFGTDEKKKDGTYMNDYILNLDTYDTSKLLNSHIFVVYYRRDLENFYLDNFDENKEKYFIFILLDSVYPIFEDEDVLISVLDYNFKLKIDKTTKNLLIEYGQGGSLEKAIFPKDNKTHLLGRKTECDLVINDPSFSREQTSFTYDPTKECWLIKDGGSQSLSRTGTWLFVDKPYCIKNNIKFKMGSSLMKIEHHNY